MPEELTDGEIITEDLPIWVTDQDLCDNCGELLGYFGECPNCGWEGVDWGDEEEYGYDDLDAYGELSFLQEYYDEHDPVVVVVTAREPDSLTRAEGSTQ